MWTRATVPPTGGNPQVCDALLCRTGPRANISRMPMFRRMRAGRAAADTSREAKNGKGRAEPGELWRGCHARL
jgi:hypothetical protein